MIVVKCESERINDSLFKEPTKKRLPKSTYFSVLKCLTEYSHPAQPLLSIKESSYRGMHPNPEASMGLQYYRHCKKRPKYLEVSQIPKSIDMVNERVCASIEGTKQTNVL